MRQFGLICAALCLSAASMLAGEKGLMHCFAYTPIETASEAEWDAFYRLPMRSPARFPG